MAEQYRKNTRFIDVLQHALNRGLQSWLDANVDKDSFEALYNYVRESIHDLFSKSSQNFTGNAKDWIAQQLYMSIRIRATGDILDADGNGTRAVPKVFDNADITQIPSDELRMIGSLLSDCDFAVDIAKELRRRA